jgi:chromosome partitioning protein
VAVANQKGGVGKTTTSISLAACLAERGHRVLAIDLDPQCNATSGLGLPKEKDASLYPVLLGDGDALSRVKPTAIPRLEMIPSELDLAGAEVDVARMDDYLFRLRNGLASVRQAARHDVAIVDCPPSLGILTMNALAAADAVLIPMQCEYFALEGLSVMVNVVERLRQSGANPALRLQGILMTMYDSRTNLAAEVIRDVTAHFGDLVYKVVIPRNVRLSESPSYGRPITLHDPQSAGAEAYRLVAREFAEREFSRRPASAPLPQAPRDEEAAVRELERIEIEARMKRDHSKRFKVFRIRRVAATPSSPAASPQPPPEAATPAAPSTAPAPAAGAPATPGSLSSAS